MERGSLRPLRSGGGSEKRGESVSGVFGAVSVFS